MRESEYRDFGFVGKWGVWWVRMLFGRRVLSG